MHFIKKILIGLIFSSSFLNAQTDFRPGYVIKDIGDTLYGEIDKRRDHLMGEICKFKAIDNTINEYSAKDIFAYRFTDNKYYISREIDGKMVFLEYLIKGRVSIYYLSDKKGFRYFIDKESYGLGELPYIEEYRNINNKRVFYRSTNHIGILNYYLQDAPELLPRIKNIKSPKCNDLIKLVEDYNYAVCNDKQCVVYKSKFPILKLMIEPVYSILKYKNYDKNINEFGVHIYLGNSRIENFYFKTGFNYQGVLEEGTKLNIYKIPVHLQYIYNAHNLRPTLNIGVSYWSTKIKSDNEEDKRFNYTFNLGAGLNYKISKSVSLSTGVNADFISPTLALANKEIDFQLISYSIKLGLFFEF